MLNVNNETQEQQTERSYLINRLSQELDNASKEVQKDNLYKMYIGEARTIMTFDYFVSWTPLEDLKIILEQVITENRK
jgi:hypothetical protein